MIRKIIEIYKSAMSPDGVMLIEHGCAQGESVRDIAEANGLVYAPLCDIEGRVRACELRLG